MQSRPFLVPCLYAHALSSHRLLQNTGPECYWLACHGLGICHIYYQSVPAEEADKHVKGALNPLRIPRSHHAAVGVQDPHTLPYRKYQSLLSNQLVIHHQHQQVPHQIIHYQVEEGGRYESSRSSPPICF